MNKLEEIRLDDLEAVTGGVDWNKSHARGAEWAARGGAAVAAIGGSLGALDGGGSSRVGMAVGGAALGGVLGVAGGYVAGLSKGVFETWNQ